MCVLGLWLHVCMRVFALGHRKIGGVTSVHWFLIMEQKYEHED